MHTLALFATLACATAAHAQDCFFEIYSGCTNFTSRGTLGASAGEYLVEVPHTHFAGVCQDATGSGTSLRAFEYVTQDQNAATQSSYSMVVRRADTSGRPDPTSAGRLLRLGPILTPPSTLATPMAWWLTSTLATPSTALPLCDTFFFGMELDAAPLWTQDGQSIHTCTYYPITNSQGDNPAPPPDVIPNLAWNIHATTGSVTQPAPRAFRLAVGSPAPVLNLGNVDLTMRSGNCLLALGQRSWGAGGMWPASNADGLGARDDGLDARVRDVIAAGGWFAIFASSSIGCPGVPVAGWFGAVHAYLGDLAFVTAGRLDNLGVGTTTVLTPGTRVPLDVMGRSIPFQAFTLGPTSMPPGRLTNVAATSYR